MVAITKTIIGGTYTGSVRGQIVDLYLDSSSEISLRKEARLFELSPSAFIRVLATIWNEPANEVFAMTIAEFRAHVREIIERENRRV